MKKLNNAKKIEKEIEEISEFISFIKYTLLKGTDTKIIVKSNFVVESEKDYLEQHFNNSRISEIILRQTIRTLRIQLQRKNKELKDLFKKTPKKHLKKTP